MVEHFCHVLYFPEAGEESGVNGYKSTNSNDCVKILSINVRSLYNKFLNVIDMIEENDVGIPLIQECWCSDATVEVEQILEDLEWIKDIHQSLL